MNSSSERIFGFETRQVHAGHIPDAETGARAVPIYQSSSFVFESAEQAARLFGLKDYGDIYTRISNPTTAVLEERLASLENATGAVVVASGMSAQFLTFLTLLEPGDEVVASSHLYGGSATQLTHTLKKLSVKVSFVAPNDVPAWKAAITPKTKLLYGETVGNPSGSVLDLEPIGKLAKAHGIPFVVDNTLATPWLCRPADFGANIILYSATKFLSGHGNAILGAVVDAGNFDFKRTPSIAAPDPAYHNLRFYDTFGHYGFLMKLRMVSLRDIGASASPMNSFLAIQGLETLSLRMERHIYNAQKIAEFLEKHSLVEWVSYPGLNSSPYHALAKKYLPRGAGGVLSFGLKGSREQARERGVKFIEALQIFSHLANIGDVRSLVIHPASTTHQQLTTEELDAAGVPPELIRISAGIENIEDLTWDLNRALHAASA
ncbi:MAG: O-acetylhomoserine aminocarboxypropyltransferase/cysteine synthase [Opitutales bacterium]|nr:O-acetylhomoserine aminocarboxypropyltransferase/cysteine synthase [Opitutales bacterium]